jgi:hypothetical protein
MSPPRIGLPSPLQKKPSHACLLTLVAVVCAAALAGCTASPAAQAGSRAALVVVHADGSVRMACVSFDEPQLTGAQLLSRSGFQYSEDAGNAMGIMICSIDGEGCDFPQSSCLCRCETPGECTYWSYFNRTNEGGWVYSPLGPSGRAVADGDVDAWVWLSGTGPGGPASSPVPDISFADVCP